MSVQPCFDKDANAIIMSELGRSVEEHDEPGIPGICPPGSWGGERGRIDAS